jgi:uncharacterized protein YdeI (YjbR/CyaY-like superfamily)
MKITHFRSPSEFRTWLAKHHAAADELWVGYYKKGSGKPSMTWPESVDQALCFGWIDGIRKSLNDSSYTIRFTPRRARSIWSNVNIARAKELTREGLMQPAGLQAYEARQADRSGIYAYEKRSEHLDDPYGKTLKRNRAAWEFYQAQPAWYRRAVNSWVVSAKKEETRLKRLEKLIEDSAGERTLPHLTRTQKSK